MTSMTMQSLSHIMDASMEDLARCPGIGERKVKRLYDTFHEPFRRVVSKPTIVQDASIQEKAEPSSVGDNGGMESVEKETAASKHGKEPVTTVKSALAAAFAKYSEKVGKQDAVEKGGKTSSEALLEKDTDKGCSGEKDS
eukprot:TRINITY_DN6522_c0_g3_i2.p1 TRINITY_DN6522_c0_g3~~TRINITY_DN6522_c0_g3_i2.p1  ORF type:complete len:140 (-),score=35.57 TRINITY_DN6522_c0_g3_i2:708-1127(-)